MGRLSVFGKLGTHIFATQLCSFSTLISERRTGSRPDEEFVLLTEQLMFNPN